MHTFVTLPIKLNTRTRTLLLSDVIPLQAPAAGAPGGDAHQEHGDKESLAAHHLARSLFLLASLKKRLPAEVGEKARRS
jgi:hypothetical protein